MHTALLPAAMSCPSELIGAIPAPHLAACWCCHLPASKQHMLLHLILPDDSIHLHTHLLLTDLQEKNRSAQRRFRQKQKQKMVSMESQVEQLTSQLGRLATENESLKSLNGILEKASSCS